MLDTFSRRCIGSSFGDHAVSSDDASIGAGAVAESILVMRSDSCVDAGGNPNGSCLDIAGIFNKNKNILGMMPHPERASDILLGSNDGELIFQSMIENTN